MFFSSFRHHNFAKCTWPAYVYALNALCKRATDDNHKPPPAPPPSGPAAVPVAGPASGSVAAAVPVAAAEAGPRFESMREMLDAASKRSEGMDPEVVEEKLKANGYNLRGLYAEFGDGDRDTFLRELGEMGVATIGQKAAIYRALKSGPRASDAIG